ncbi:hypothetical protein DFJ73DRAFT_798014 [Zopfochytrium polystomum]|nr:hypothetical protein DFJ73DRAFT_798014 [Zopfochytrium polystomum]
MSCARRRNTALLIAIALLAVASLLQAFAAAASTSDSNYLYRALHEGDEKDLSKHGEIRAAGRTQQGEMKNKCYQCGDPKNCAACHVGNGALYPSNYISTTTSRDTAKGYASEKNGRVAVIDRSKLPADKVKDLSTLKGRLDHLGSTYSSKKTDLGPNDKTRPGIKDPRLSTHQEVVNRAHLFAKHNKEVLVEGSIPKDCIVEVADAGSLRRRAGGAACKRKAGPSSSAKQSTAGSKGQKAAGGASGGSKRGAAAPAATKPQSAAKPAAAKPKGRNGLEIKYDERPLVAASASGDVAALEFWKRSGLELRYSERPMDAAIQAGAMAALGWWKGSGLELKYTWSLVVEVYRWEGLIGLWRTGWLRIPLSSV